MNSAKVGYVACYVCLIGFVGLACVQTHRLFGSQKPTHKLTAKTETVPVERREASVEVPSLFSSLQPDEPPAKSEEAILQETQADFVSKNYDHVIATLEPRVQSGTRSALRDRMREFLARSYDAKATALLQHNGFDDAVACYRKGAALQPSEPQYKVHLANALFYLATQAGPQKGTATLQEACRIATEVTKTEPQYLSAYQVLAEAQEAIGNKAAAKSALQRIINLSGKGSATYKRAAERLDALSKGV